MSQEKLYRLQLLSETESVSFFNLIQNNSARLEDFFAGTLRKTKTLEASLHYCKELDHKIRLKEYFPYLIIEEKSNALIGFIDVKNIDWSIPKAELGAFIDRCYEGNGIIFHHVGKLIETLVAEHNFKKIFCRVAPRNVRSIRVVERLGFSLEGTIRCDYRTTKGELVDLNYYGRIFN